MIGRGLGESAGTPVSEPAFQTLAALYPVSASAPRPTGALGMPLVCEPFPLGWAYTSAHPPQDQAFPLHQLVWGTLPALSSGPKEGLW